jgi:hypothetical protein
VIDIEGVEDEIPSQLLAYNIGSMGAPMKFLSGM